MQCFGHDASTRPWRFLGGWGRATVTKPAGKPIRFSRWWTGAAGVLLIASLGFVFSVLPPLFHQPTVIESPPTPAGASVDPRLEPKKHLAQMRQQEIRKRFDEAVVMLHAKKFDYAIASLHKVLLLSPRLPEAHLNMGFALLGLEKFASARDFFMGAVDLKPRGANAYYGLAVAHEGLGQWPEAVGAMRTYLHLSPSDARHRRKARAALWEWEARMGRRNGDGKAETARQDKDPGDGKPNGGD